ncbi:hypothetical protein C5S53_04775 [Methanophagales archaeon]|nr:hypothetical protein C5S53_04775 [Methanophagales archaeon]
MAETESEMTAAANAVAKRMAQTDGMCVVAVKKAQEGVIGVLGAFKYGFRTNKRNGIYNRQKES